MKQLHNNTHVLYYTTVYYSTILVLYHDASSTKHDTSLQHYTYNNSILTIQNYTVLHFTTQQITTLLYSFIQESITYGILHNTALYHITVHDITHNKAQYTTLQTI